MHPVLDVDASARMTRSQNPERRHAVVAELPALSSSPLGGSSLEDGCAWPVSGGPPGQALAEMDPYTLVFSGNDSLEAFHRNYRAIQMFVPKIILNIFGLLNLAFLGAVMSPSLPILLFSIGVCCAGMGLVAVMWCASEQRYRRQQMLCASILWMGCASRTVTEMWSNNFQPDQRNHGFDTTSMILILAMPCMELRFTLAVGLGALCLLTYFLPRILFREAMAVEPLELVQQLGVFLEVLLVTLIASYELERRSRMLSAVLWIRELRMVSKGRSAGSTISRLNSLRRKASHRFLLDDFRQAQSAGLPVEMGIAEAEPKAGSEVRSVAGVGVGTAARTSDEKRRVIEGVGGGGRRAREDRGGGSGGSQPRGALGRSRMRRGSVTANILEEMRAKEQQSLQLRGAGRGDQQQQQQLPQKQQQALSCITPMLLPPAVEVKYQDQDHDEATECFAFNLGLVLALECCTGLFDIVEDNLLLLMVVRYAFILPLCLAAIAAVHFCGRHSAAFKQHIFIFTSVVLFLNLSGFMYMLLQPPWSIVDRYSAIAKVCCGFAMICTDMRLPLTHAVGTTVTGVVLYALWIHVIPRTESNTPAAVAFIDAIRLYQPVLFTLALGFWMARQAEISRREKYIIDCSNIETVTLQKEVSQRDGADGANATPSNGKCDRAESDQVGLEMSPASFLGPAPAAPVLDSNAQASCETVSCQDYFFKVIAEDGSIYYSSSSGQTSWELPPNAVLMPP